MSAISGIAQPLDPDLDLFIEGLHLSAVQVFDNEFIVGLYAEEGRWDMGEGMVDVKNIEMDLVFGLAVAVPGDEARIGHYVTLLERWRDDYVPLTLCSAVGRTSSLSEDSAHWLPIPRGDHPHWSGTTT